MSEPTVSAAPRRRRLGWILVASLALNLFFIGLVGATAWNWRYHHGMRAGFGPAGWMVPILPDELRQQLRERILQRRMDTHERGLEVKQAQLAVVKALAAQPYDKEAAERAFAELRQRFARMQEVIHQTIVEAANDLTPEQRQALIDRFPSNP